MHIMEENVYYPRCISSFDQALNQGGGEDCIPFCIFCTVYYLSFAFVLLGPSPRSEMTSDAN